MIIPLKRYNMYFDDIINASLLRSKYEEYERILSSNSILEIRVAVRDFLTFIRDIKAYVSGNLRAIIERQEKIAKELLLTIRIRYLIIFAYKAIVNRLVKSLVNAIKSFVSMLTA
ncbi:MAG: hypothetical protein ASUL_02929 [Candidatus Aramenus sulfurataquae]|jgi:hypothetical protein|uniref:Uncharacterized protein n=3 Tax=Candidatus Aramenus sulfurataquae TaxID=1326980 RepID=W7KPE0_9CREN|nr:MAG: hypothetical protein ASUL_02929 [Candidatus Aramenus sulfurataquae]